MRWKADILENWANENNICCFRGNEDNVLDRYYQAALFFKVNTIVRITADDPFKDAEIIDQVVQFFFNEKLDFANNIVPPTFPEGLDTEVFSFVALEKAWKEVVDMYKKEHVTQYFFRHPEIFRQKSI